MGKKSLFPLLYRLLDHSFYELGNCALTIGEGIAAFDWNNSGAIWG